MIDTYFRIILYRIVAVILRSFSHNKLWLPNKIISSQEILKGKARQPLLRKPSLDELNQKIISFLLFCLSDQVLQPGMFCFRHEQLGELVSCQQHSPHL